MALSAAVWLVMAAKKVWQVPPVCADFGILWDSAAGTGGSAQVYLPGDAGVPVYGVHEYIGDGQRRKADF